MCHRGFQLQLPADRDAIVLRHRRFEHDVEELAQHVQEPAKLKEAVKALYRKHAADTPPDGDPGGDLQREYTRHVFLNPETCNP